MKASKTAIPLMLCILLVAAVRSRGGTVPIPRQEPWPDEFFAHADSAAPDELFRMALLLEDGTPRFPPDTAASLALLQKAAAMKSPQALNYLGFKYIKGEGVERQPLRGLELIKEAARRGDPKSYNNLGWLYLTGEYVERDLPLAIQWLTRAADAGLPTAAVTLADLYIEGKDVAPDTLRADSLYLAAADAGFHDAEYRLLHVHRAGIDTLRPDSSFAIGCRAYAKGRHIFAFHLIKKGADAGIPRAMALLAHAYSTGLGTPYDYDLANRWFYLAALAGDPSAQFIVAETLEVFPDALTTIPPGDAQIIDDPAYWYRKALQGGVSDAAQALDKLTDCSVIYSPPNNNTSSK